MNLLFVVSDPGDWAIDIPGVTVVSARAYLTDPAFGEDRDARVFNLCRHYRYQGFGYYVSLLAEARGHDPLPTVSAIEDLQSPNVVRLLTEDLDELIQRLFAPIKSNAFELSIYFGRNVAGRYDLLCQQIFSLLPAPLLRAYFDRPNGQWRLRRLQPIAPADIPLSHHECVVEAALDYFAGRKRRLRKRTTPRYDLAILHDPDDPEPPSNAKAMQKFEKAAAALDMQVQFITRADFDRLAEFDALFIRDTTAVNHYTYRFARRAAAEGLVVIDDPDSILRCTNKVYLAELLARHHVPTPRTLLVHRDNVQQIAAQIALPCVLKQPDSAFSKGVVKVESAEEMLAKAGELLEKSELIIAQEYLPTEFDWRVGILDRRPLYVCKYFMAAGHWQIIKREEERKLIEGPARTLSVGEAPEEVVKAALRAANLIGEGFYGVDLKQVGDRCYVIEVNDNPNVDAGCEDSVLKDALYREIMGVFLRRIEAHKRCLPR